MSKPAIASGEYSLAYDPLKFNMKAVFAYEVNNYLLLRKRKLTQRHNDLSEEERQELNNLKVVESYLNNRLEELKAATA